MRLGYFFRGVGDFDTAMKYWNNAMVDIESLRGKDSFETFGLDEDQADTLKKQVEEAIDEATRARAESK